MTKIVLCGIQEQGKEIISFLQKNNIKISYIVTISKELAEKNKCAETLVSYEEFAKKENISIYYANSYSLNSPEDIQFFSDQQFDLLLLGGWQRLIPEVILNTITYFGIGQHGSPEFLPNGRGRSPLNWSIILGRKRLVWNIFSLKPGVDDGDILDYEIFDINEFDTCETLYFKVSTAVKHMILRTIKNFDNGRLKPIKQTGEPTYFLKRSPDDGKISWDKTPEEIYNLIRGITKPYPGAFTIFNNNKIKIWKAQPWTYSFDYYINNSVGEIVEIFNNQFVVKCYSGLLLITEHEDSNIFIGKKYEF